MSAPERAVDTHRRAPRRRLWLLLGALASLVCCDPAAKLGAEALRALESDAPSVSKGTASRGRLVRGKRMPAWGPNFTTYSGLGALLGRTATHHKVRDTLLDAYAQLAQTHPDRRFIYGELGWPSGGRFYPHRTHRNGLSVDLIAPTLDADGAPAALTCVLWNAYCYGLDADAKGRFTTWPTRTLDLDALAAHLAALHKAAPRHGLRLKRVILAPDLQRLLRATRVRRRLLRGVRFMPRPAWVRHDDHYHVDFAVHRRSP